MQALAGILMPPYLVAAPPAGLVAYTKAVAAATDLPLIAYQRSNAVFDPEAAVELARIPRVVGFKDGLGDIELLSRIVITVRRAVDGDGERACCRGRGGSRSVRLVRPRRTAAVGQRLADRDPREDGGADAVTWLLAARRTCGASVDCVQVIGEHGRLWTCAIRSCAL